MRCTCIFLGLLSFVIAAGLSSCISSKKKVPIKPNVVVFLVDDLGSGELECYASKFHETPNIDALAERGMLFTQAYSGSTLCSPSRAALLTGRSPARLQCWHPHPLFRFPSASFDIVNPKISYFKI